MIGKIKIVATIEARMTSTRLPGKVLLQALEKPMLYHLVTRLRTVPSIDHIVLATTHNRTDDVLEEFAKQEKLSCFRGSEEDVMSRVIGAAESADADVIVQITGDCPIIDPELIEQTIRMFNAHDVDHVSNAHIRSYPDGMDTAVFTLSALKKSSSMTDDVDDHEHVSLHLRKHPELFPAIYLVAPPELHWPELGLTLDEPQDYKLLKKLIEYFGTSQPLFGCLDVVRLLRQKPEWVQINESVKRKSVVLD